MVKESVAHVEDTLVIMDEDANEAKMLESRLDTCIEELSDIEGLEDVSDLFRDALNALQEKLQKLYPNQEWYF